MKIKMGVQKCQGDAMVQVLPFCCMIWDQINLQFRKSSERKNGCGIRHACYRCHASRREARNCKRCVVSPTDSVMLALAQNSNQLWICSQGNNYQSQHYYWNATPGKAYEFLLTVYLGVLNFLNQNWDFWTCTYYCCNETTQ